MLYLFHGSDVHAIRSKAFAWVAATRAKAPEAFYTRIDADSVTEDVLLESLGTQGLFFSKSILLLDDLFAKKASGELFMEYLDEIAASPNAVALLAPKVLATQLKKIEPKATKVFKEDKVAKAARGFNGPLVNALGSRDREQLWLELMRAQRQGDVPEMLHGLLHWKARDMMQKGSSTWGKEGARKLSVQLIKLVASSRDGSLPLGPALERFALTL